MQAINQAVFVLTGDRYLNVAVDSVGPVTPGVAIALTRDALRAVP